MFSRGKLRAEAVVAGAITELTGVTNVIAEGSLGGVADAYALIARATKQIFFTKMVLRFLRRTEDGAVFALFTNLRLRGNACADRAGGVEAPTPAIPAVAVFVVIRADVF